METKLILDQAVKARDSKIIVATEQDVEPILEHNKMLRAQQQKSDWGRHIASIPNVIITKWLNEEWAAGNSGLQLFSKEFDELVKKKLADPDWAFLRTDDKMTSYMVGFNGN